MTITLQQLRDFLYVCFDPDEAMKLTHSRQMVNAIIPPASEKRREYSTLLSEQLQDTTRSLSEIAFDLLSRPTISSEADAERLLNDIWKSMSDAEWPRSQAKRTTRGST